MERLSTCTARALPACWIGARKRRSPGAKSLADWSMVNTAAKDIIARKRVISPSKTPERCRKLKAGTPGCEDQRHAAMESRTKIAIEARDVSKGAARSP